MSTNTKAISDDILKVARDIAASRYIGSQWSHMRDYFADGLYDNDPVVLSAAKAIHDAVMAERERDQWQTIETAPKDGTDILVAHYRRPGVEMVSWKGGPKKCVWHTEDKIGSYGLGFFTHWQPLPAAPKSEG